MGSWIDYWNRRVRKLTIVDLKLVQVGSMAGILIIVKWFPQIMNVNIWWFVALFIICMLRPVYSFWIEGDDTGQKARSAETKRDMDSATQRDATEMEQRIAQIEADIGDIKEQIADFIIKQV